MEWYNRATGEAHPHPCMHDDLTHIVPAGSFDPEGTFAQRSRQIDQAKLNTKQWCHHHGQFCTLFGHGAPEIDYDISGLPCPDMSRAGRLLREEGPTSTVFTCHAKMHIELQTPLLVVENVWVWVQSKYIIHFKRDR